MFICACLNAVPIAALFLNYAWFGRVPNESPYVRYTLTTR
jgi:hypothetical protein